MDDTFDITVRGCGPDACEVTVAGELDVATAPDLRTVLHQALAGYRRITIDMTALQFCDCAGLGMLVAVARTAKTEGAELRLHAVPHALTRLLRHFPTGGAFTVEPAEPDRSSASGPGPLVGTTVTPHQSAGIIEHRLRVEQRLPRRDQGHPRHPPRPFSDLRRRRRRRLRPPRAAAPRRHRQLPGRHRACPAQPYELTEISRHLILEELSETLAGFRTLLSNNQWTQEGSPAASPACQIASTMIPAARTIPRPR
ncbi:STAS domain-containing protein [Streptomyces sp. NPDC046557]|uniref:STAS domain-containing protein n=1 Tax=Streptomyces sp. NPDC046557 TaxID=3155372 RepID=UPI0034094FF8